MSEVRRCLGCAATYPPDGHACPECGSHAAELEQEKASPKASSAKVKPARRRKT